MPCSSELFHLRAPARQTVAAGAVQLILALLLVLPISGSVQCGRQGQAPCDSSCGVHYADDPLQHFSWCPTFPVGKDGCIPGLTQVAPSATATANPICLPLPVAPACGKEGHPCCLVPSIVTTRAGCGQGLGCMLHTPTPLPYAGVAHLKQLAGSKSGAIPLLLSTSVMGTCRKMSPSDAFKLYGPCGSRGRELLGRDGSCPMRTYCASPEDHRLGPEPRCLPLPRCGGPLQQCCPPNAILAAGPGRPSTSSSSSSSRKSLLPGVQAWVPQQGSSSSHSRNSPLARSLLGADAVVPFCTAPGAICFWPGMAAPTGQLDEPFKDSYSVVNDLSKTLCVPGLTACGGRDQPCCPHVQFGASNTPMFFRRHICNAGLRCDATIQLWGPDGPVVGRCRGKPSPCGALGQACCERPDAGGWVWPVCMDGQAGHCCNPKSKVCERCS